MWGDLAGGWAARRCWGQNEGVTTVRTHPIGEVIASRTRRCTDLTELAAAVCDVYRSYIPYAFGCLATTDPSTGLVSWAFKTHPLAVGDREWAALEYGGPDVNLFAEVARRPEPVGVLSIDTDGDVASCRRMREFLHPRFGFTDELRVAFRAQGLTWGAIALSRGAGEPSFTEADARLAVSVHAQVAELIQDMLFHPRESVTTAYTGPAVIMIDAADRVSNMTPAAHARVDELGGWDNGALPATVLATATAARTTPELATNRAVSRDGAWLALRAPTFTPPAGGAPAGAVVVTIDVASPPAISSLARAARGLSPREQEVARLVLQGAATTAIATSLHLSPHTVQDHLKSIFGKLHVNSRREMVQQLVLR